MIIELAIARRRHWIPSDERPSVETPLRWRIVEWWRPEAWFYRPDNASHWNTGIGWLWFRIRIGGGD